MSRRRPEPTEPRDPKQVSIEFPEGKPRKRATQKAETGHTRRDFLRYAAVGAAGIGAGLAAGGALFRYLTPEGALVEVTSFPRMEVAKIGDLTVDSPIVFRYPLDHPHHDNILVKLGRPAMGGVGPGADIVAFNTTCTHMGCSLLEGYKGLHKIVGPCPCHFTTFDLAKRGIVVLGQATQALPQVVLEVEGDAIYAVGVSRLVYGFRNDLKDAAPVRG